MNLTMDQLASAAGYITRNWGDHHYRVEAIESPTHAVSVFSVVCSDGARFSIAADKWGNVRHLPDNPARAAESVRDMHQMAVTP